MIYGTGMDIKMKTHIHCFMIDLFPHQKSQSPRKNKFKVNDIKMKRNTKMTKLMSKC